MHDASIVEYPYYNLGYKQQRQGYHPTVVLGRKVLMIISSGCESSGATLFLWIWHMQGHSYSTHSCAKEIEDNITAYPDTLGFSLFGGFISASSWGLENHYLYFK